MSGGVLLSHDLPVAVPSALAGLTSRFGMETGCFPDAMATETLSKYQPTTCSSHNTPGGVGVLGLTVFREPYSERENLVVVAQFVVCCHTRWCGV
jgi:hypothetical protein